MLRQSLVEATPLRAKGQARILTNSEPSRAAPRAGRAPSNLVAAVVNEGLPSACQRRSNYQQYRTHLAGRRLKRLLYGRHHNRLCRPTGRCRPLVGSATLGGDRTCGTAAAPPAAAGRRRRAQWRRKGCNAIVRSTTGCASRRGSAQRGSLTGTIPCSNHKNPRGGSITRRCLAAGLALARLFPTTCGLPIVRHASLGAG